MMIKKLASTLLLAALLLASLAALVTAQEPTPPPKGPDPLPTEPAAPPAAPDIAPNILSKIEPQLLKRLLTGDSAAPFIVHMQAQANLEAAAASAPLSALGAPDPVETRRAIVDALQQTAHASQAGVLNQLGATGGGLSGQSAPASDVRPLWIVNAVAARGALDTVLALAARPDVKIIRLDKTIRLNPAAESGTPPRAAAHRPDLQTPEWGVSKIRADEVWNALGFDGSGVVVANIDSGVDWNHPDLQSNYRGYTGPGKVAQHSGNWFDATGAGATYPVDGNGHGTHTMGTIAGQNGTGVAPGARWIAARAFDSSGAGKDSWLHAALQWMMAPALNSALAPDIINNSWSSNNGFSTEFQADILALQAAGVYPVFAAGNNGPGSGSVGSPGSLSGVFAVGATDSSDVIANFSGRGPSPWGQIKPQVSAPGVDVRSTLPGGAYGTFSGTSMATPHVAGAAALLLQASPVLTGDGISNALMSTAVPLGSPIPNNNYGWGRIDAYSAVLSVAGAGTLAGTITDSVTSQPVGGALVQIMPALGGPTITSAAGSGGNYTQGLAAGAYNVTASAFGYSTSSAKLVNVNTGATTVQNFSLSRLQVGYLTGTVTDAGSGAPLTAIISIENTPVTAATVAGSYALTLPVGIYTATVTAAEHRITQAVNINISPGNTTTRNFALAGAPSILLVDSGTWYGDSQSAFFEQALRDARYTHDTRHITNPTVTPTDVPTTSELLPYDIVIWSAPKDSPGYVGANSALKGYLDSGGRLLLSGQDVAYYDSGASLAARADYLDTYLMVDYVADSSSETAVNGVAGQPFAGLALSLNGGDGANNQNSPDVVAVDNSDFAGGLLQYGGSVDNLAGLHVGLCRPYRAIFLAFGLEGINSRSDRSQVMAQSIDWLMQTPAVHGVELTAAKGTQIGNFGDTVAHTFRLRNTGTAADTFSLARTGLGPYNWSTSAPPSPVGLASCASQQITVTVQVPAAKSWHITDSFTISAQSTAAPTLTDVITRYTKTPAPVLLVDDDRWYSFAAEFKQALGDNGIPYDYWLVPKSFTGSEPPSPPAATLAMYPMIVWYTAYDWYQPLTVAEEDRLMDYLDNSGRLFFSSQDFLWRHKFNHGGEYAPFAQDYLGVLAHTEDFTTTVTHGELGNPVGTLLGPYPLTFPPGYQNFTDALTPTTSAGVASRGQADQPNGVTNAGTVDLFFPVPTPTVIPVPTPTAIKETWRTNFLAYGPELLGRSEHARLMQRSVGWLSWLGASTVTAEANSVGSGSWITFTATITNDGWDDLSTAVFTATFPTYLTPGSGTFNWSGPLAANQSQTFTYTAQINQPLPTGTVISQTSWLAYPAHNILFDRVAAVPVTPNFGESSLNVLPAAGIQQNDTLTYTLVLRNRGMVGSGAVTTTSALPNSLQLLGAAAQAGTVISSGNALTWTAASLGVGAETTLTVRAVVSATGLGTIRNVAQVDDGFNRTVVLAADASFKVWPYYFPVIVKNSTP